MTDVIVSGEWLLEEFNYEHDYRVGYQLAALGRPWSGGVAGAVTRQVMERIVSDAMAERDNNPDLDVLEWHDDVVEWTAPAVDPSFVEILGPDAAGLYPIPSWTWQQVDPDDCTEVVRPMKPSCPDCGLVHYTIHCPDELRTEEPEVTDQLELRPAERVAEHTGRIELSDVLIDAPPIIADDYDPDAPVESYGGTFTEADQTALDAPPIIDDVDKFAKTALDRYDVLIRANRSPGWDTLTNVATDDSGEAFSELVDEARELYGDWDIPDGLWERLHQMFGEYQAKLLREVNLEPRGDTHVLASDRHIETPVTNTFVGPMHILTVGALRAALDGVPDHLGVVIDDGVSWWDNVAEVIIPGPNDGNNEYNTVTLRKGEPLDTRQF